MEDEVSDDIEVEEYNPKGYKIKLHAFCFVFTLQAGIVATIVVFVALLIAITILLLYGLLVYYPFDMQNAIGLTVVFLHMFMIIISISFAFEGAYKEDFRYMNWAAVFMIVALVLYFAASVVSFVPSIYKYVCPGDRCPDHVWLQNSYWRNSYFKDHDEDDADRVEESTPGESENYEDWKYEDYNLKNYPQFAGSAFKDAHSKRIISPGDGNRFRRREPTRSPELTSKTKKSKRRRIKNFVTSYESLTLRPESQKPPSTEITVRKRHLHNEDQDELPNFLVDQYTRSPRISPRLELVQTLIPNIDDYTDDVKVPDMIEYESRDADYDYEDYEVFVINYSEDCSSIDDEKDSSQRCSNVGYPFFGVLCSAFFNVLYLAFLIYVIVVYIAFRNELKEGPLFTTV